MAKNDNRLTHLLIKNSAKAHNYTSTKRPPNPKYPERNRAEQAYSLLSQFNEVEQNTIIQRKKLPIGALVPEGIYVDFESEPGFDLAVKSLDLPSLGVEVLNVRTLEEENKGQKTIATVYIPDDKVSTFVKKIEQYGNEQIKGPPKNKTLVNSISNVRLSIVQSLWTDLDDIFPEKDELTWWEVWLRATPNSITNFKNFTTVRNIPISNRWLSFPDRHVLLAYTTANKFAEAIESLDFIAELRLAKETTAEFLKMSKREQQEWIDALKGLINSPSGSAPVVCILDRGVNNQHTLINPFLPLESMQSCNPDWGVHDNDGHGTGMAGITLFGDMENALLATSRIEVPANLESIKILPPLHHEPNHRDVYGSITEEAANRATIISPDKERIFCMAVTSRDARKRGRPSSWSASIDRICAGQAVPGKKHLFIISAGNTPKDAHITYPDSNLSDGIHDPAQSWNALTVGAFTEKVNISESSFRGWKPLATVGDLSPSTTTSLTWERQSPIKPEVVFEGGNAAINESRSLIDYPDSLSLLTTNHETTNAHFTWFADTSAASAQAANMAAKLSSNYPNFWPETLRGLIVHSAEITPRMKEMYPSANKVDRARALRIHGYGVPNLEKALWSAKNSLTLIAQDSLKPFESKAGKKELNLHEIPWPVEALKLLGDKTVKMKVTLSYFIEPNPGRRGEEVKFKYHSCGLRFEVKTSLESLEEFQKRINLAKRDEESKSLGSESDSEEWFYGKQTQTKGSIHSDWWEGSAESLLEKSYVAVYPTVGWWSVKYKTNNIDKKIRYSLIVTLETSETKVDIYTPVKNLISIQVKNTIRTSNE